MTFANWPASADRSEKSATCARAAAIQSGKRKPQPARASNWNAIEGVGRFCRMRRYPLPNQSTHEWLLGHCQRWRHAELSNLLLCQRVNVGSGNLQRSQVPATRSDKRFEEWHRSKGHRSHGDNLVLAGSVGRASRRRNNQPAAPLPEAWNSIRSASSVPEDRWRRTLPELRRLCAETLRPGQMSRSECRRALNYLRIIVDQVEQHERWTFGV